MCWLSVHARVGKTRNPGQMVEGITEKKLGDFQEFEDWLDKLQLLDLEVLYRGHAESTWRLEKHTIPTSTRIIP